MKFLTKIFLTIIFLSVFYNINAQDLEEYIPNLETTNSKNNSPPVYLFGFNFGYDIPLMNMAKDFGNNFIVGAKVHYQNSRKVEWQLFADYITGATVKNDSLFKNISLNKIEMYNIQGGLDYPTLFERGYNIGFGLGKFINFTNLNHKILLSSSLSFLQHKINIINPGKDIYPILGIYSKGYDRLTNGICFNESISLLNYLKKNVSAWSVSLNVKWALTKNRRSVNFDTGLGDNSLRNDVMVGISSQWFFAKVNKKKDYYFIY